MARFSGKNVSGRGGYRWALSALLVTLSGAVGVGTARAQFLGTNFLTGNASGATAAGGGGATAVGGNATASGAGGATAVGRFSEASGQFTVALGRVSTASGDNSTAIGDTALATADNSTAIGGFTFASGTDSTVLGNASGASGVDSTALGFASTANFNNSTALGANAATTRNDQIALGTASNTYTAAGITSAASAAAQTGPKQVVTTDANGNLAASNFNALGLATTDQLERTTEGVSMAMALSGVPNILPENANYAVSSDVGIFDNETAIALGGTARLADSVFFNGGGAVSTSSGTGGGRAGVTYAW